jgi:hypothetical protein
MERSHLFAHATVGSFKYAFWRSMARRQEW